MSNRSSRGGRGGYRSRSGPPGDPFAPSSITPRDPFAQPTVTPGDPFASSNKTNAPKDPFAQPSSSMPSGFDVESFQKNFAPQNSSSSFGQKAQSSAFSQESQRFGQASFPQASNAFAGGFGAAPSSFGSTGAFGQNQNTSFGQSQNAPFGKSANAAPFGQVEPSGTFDGSNSAPFGQNSGFSQPSNAGSALPWGGNAAAFGGDVFGNASNRGAKTKGMGNGSGDPFNSAAPKPSFPSGSAGFSGNGSSMKQHGDPFAAPSKGGYTGVGRGGGDRPQKTLATNILIKGVPIALFTEAAMKLHFGSVEGVRVLNVNLRGSIRAPEGKRTALISFATPEETTLAMNKGKMFSGSPLYMSYHRGPSADRLDTQKEMQAVRESNELIFFYVPDDLFSEDAVRNLFNSISDNAVIEVSIRSRPDHGTMKKTALVVFKDVESATMALQNLPSYHGEKLQVHYRRKPSHPHITKKESHFRGDSAASNLTSTHQNEHEERMNYNFQGDSAMGEKEDGKEGSSFMGRASVSIENEPQGSNLEERMANLRKNIQEMEALKRNKNRGGSSHKQNSQAGLLQGQDGSVKALRKSSEEEMRRREAKMYTNKPAKTDGTWRRGVGNKVAISDAKQLKGTCQKMCPVKEWEDRVLQRDVSPFEKSLGEPDESKAVKKYRRSAAISEEPLPEEIRPPSVLLKTMNHLRNICDSLDTTFADIHNFVRDRTRSLRQDFTYQGIRDEICIAIHEESVRFHILSEHRLCGTDPSIFSSKQNREQLDKCLISLREMYDLRRENHLPMSKNEPEMQAYYLLTQMSQPQTCAQLLTGFTREVRHSLPLQFALQIMRTYSESICDYSGFFSCLRAAPYLLACLMHSRMRLVRCQAVRSINISYGTSNTRDVIELSTFSKQLGFPNEQDAIAFCDEVGLEITTITSNGGSQGFKALLVPSKLNYTALDEVTPKTPDNFIELKANGFSPSQIISGQLRDSFNLEELPSCSLPHLRAYQAKVPRPRLSAGVRSSQPSRLNKVTNNQWWNVQKRTDEPVGTSIFDRLGGNIKSGIATSSTGTKLEDSPGAKKSSPFAPNVEQENAGATITANPTHTQVHSHQNFGMGFGNASVSGKFVGSSGFAQLPLVSQPPNQSKATPQVSSQMMEPLNPAPLPNTVLDNGLVPPAIPILKDRSPVKPELFKKKRVEFNTPLDSRQKSGIEIAKTNQYVQSVAPTVSVNARESSELAGKPEVQEDAETERDTKRREEEMRENIRKKEEARREEAEMKAKQEEEKRREEDRARQRLKYQKLREKAIADQQEAIAFTHFSDMAHEAKLEIEALSRKLEKMQVSFEKLHIDDLGKQAMLDAIRILENDFEEVAKASRVQKMKLNRCTAPSETCCKLRNALMTELNTVIKTGNSLWKRVWVAKGQAISSPEGILFPKTKKKGSYSNPSQSLKRKASTALLREDRGEAMHTLNQARKMLKKELQLEVDEIAQAMVRQCVLRMQLVVLEVQSSSGPAAKTHLWMWQRLIGKNTKQRSLAIMRRAQNDRSVWFACRNVQMKSNEQIPIGANLVICSVDLSTEERFRCQMREVRAALLSRRQQSTVITAKPVLILLMCVGADIAFHDAKIQPAEVKAKAKALCNEGLVSEPYLVQVPRKVASFGDASEQLNWALRKSMEDVKKNASEASLDLQKCKFGDRVLQVGNSAWLKYLGEAKLVDREFPTHLGVIDSVNSAWSGLSKVLEEEENRWMEDMNGPRKQLKELRNIVRRKLRLPLPKELKASNAYEYLSRIAILAGVSRVHVEVTTPTNVTIAKFCRFLGTYMTQFVGRMIGDAFDEMLYLPPPSALEHDVSLTVHFIRHRLGRLEDDEADMHGDMEMNTAGSAKSKEKSMAAVLKREMRRTSERNWAVSAPQCRRASVWKEPQVGMIRKKRESLELLKKTLDFSTPAPTRRRSSSGIEENRGMQLLVQEMYEAAEQQKRAMDETIAMLQGEQV